MTLKKIIGGVCLVAITLNLGFANQTNDSLKDNDNNIWDVAFVYVYQDRPATLHSKYIEVGNIAKVVPSWNNKDGTRYADGLEGTSARTDFSFDGIFEMFYGEMKSNMSSVADGFNTYRLKDSSAIGVGSNASEPGSLYIAQEFKLIIQDFDDDGYIFPDTYDCGKVLVGIGNKKSQHNWWLAPDNDNTQVIDSSNRTVTFKCNNDKNTHIAFKIDSHRVNGRSNYFRVTKA